MKVLVVLGTRPEAIKLAPVIRELKAAKGFRVRVCLTAQHREMLDSMLRTFRIRPDIDLDLMHRDQSPAEVLRRVGPAMAAVLKREKPGLVVVQGDTTSALGAALAAERAGIPVAHIEAGLRSFDLKNPYPEEGNRVRIDAASALLFAPTEGAKRNLLKEGIDPRRIFVTGNTAVDSLLWASRRSRGFRNRSLRALPLRAKLAVITLHRRESFGRPLERVLLAIRDSAQALPGIVWAYPVHPNPHVRRAALRVLGGHPRIILTAPLEYLDFVQLLKRSSFIVTDSGGIQEEAPSLGKAVLVIREKTERPELLGRGGVLVGTSRPRLLSALRRLASGRLPRLPRRNPFGDGRASARIARAIRRWSLTRPAKTGRMRP